MKRFQPPIWTVSQCWDLGDALIEARCLRPGIEALRSGGILALPTDTIYGIAALAQNKKAVQKIYDAKRRIENKPLAICVGDTQQVYKWCEVTISPTLLKSLLPGPVTLVFTRRDTLNTSLNPGNPLVGVRIPDYPLIRDLCNKLDEPIALTSANISNQQSAVRIEEFHELWPELSMIYDGGMLGEREEQRLGSTVVNLSACGHFTIIRRGSAHTETRRLLLDHDLIEESHPDAIRDYKRSTN